LAVTPAGAVHVAREAGWAVEVEEAAGLGTYVEEGLGKELKARVTMTRLWLLCVSESAKKKKCVVLVLRYVCMDRYRYIS
jgi:hypothetical protein